MHVVNTVYSCSFNTEVSGADDEKTSKKPSNASQIKTVYYENYICHFLTYFHALFAEKIKKYIYNKTCCYDGRQEVRLLA